MASTTQENDNHYNGKVVRLSFFIGKGGVGKTTVSAAYALRVAQEKKKKRILLLSTDPAHSLSDVLQIPLGDDPKRVALPGSGNLHAWQLNSQKFFLEFVDEHKQGILDLLDAGSLFSREDIEPLLNAALPGMAEVAGLLAIRGALVSKKYAHVIVDTAPFGHTLRLFSLPESFLRFVNFLELASGRDAVLAEHFGGRRRQPSRLRFLDEWRAIVGGVRSAFADSADIFLVTTPERFSLNESLRCSQQLITQAPVMQISEVILNRHVPRAGTCAVCRKRSKASASAQGFLRTHFPRQRLHLGEDPGVPLIGVKALIEFGNHVFGGEKLKWNPRAKKVDPVRLKKAEWPLMEPPLTLVLGKGGVGKTTISAALGFNTRKKKKQPVQICSVDPAPSLDDIFQTAIGNEPVPVLGDPDFRASEMDSVAIFSRWVREVRHDIEQATGTEVSGIHIDLSFERSLLVELLEIVPPGLDEILAIFRVIDLLANGSEKIGIDMAPTGHALELLRMPARILAWTKPLLKTMASHRTLASARDAAVMIAMLGQRVRELTELLKRSTSSQIFVVLLPESLPDRETERLVSSLKSMQLMPKAIFLNRVLFAKDAGECGRCRRSLWFQQNTMAGLKKKYFGIDIYAVRNFPDEIAGKAALAKFTGELWQLA